MRVLVVEDEALIALLIRQALLRAGHEVIGPVASAALALRLAQDEAVDLVLLDIHLGRGGSGLQVARCFQGQQGPPCLFASSSVDEAQGARELALGLLSKPFGSREVVLAVAAVEAILAGTPPAPLPPGLELF